MKAARLIASACFARKALIGYLILVFATGWALWGIHNTVANNTETTRALCAFRLDLQRRHDAGVAYVNDHPGKFPFPGITRNALNLQIHNQQATLDALAGLDCEETP